jgi:hypothetical protein
MPTTKLKLLKKVLDLNKLIFIKKNTKIFKAIFIKKKMKNISFFLNMYLLTFSG